MTPATAQPVNSEELANALAAAIRFETVSSPDDPELNAKNFEALHAYLRQRFPLVHEKLTVELVGGLSLLYTWKGSSSEAKPVGLMAHQDVVPLAPGTESKWREPPFSGEIKDGYVWGRGTWDDKANLIAQLEAVEMLLGSGFVPRQTVYLIYGADEESMGLRGAAQIAALLQERGVRLDFVIDEGLLLTDGVMPGLSTPAAFIGIAEKGYLSVSLKVLATPGHSSMPPARGASAVAMMSAALHRLDEEQLPARVQGVGREMLETVAPEMRGIEKVALSNLWLFEPLVVRQLEPRPGPAAMLRTTTALTIVNAGNKENVLPGEAYAVVKLSPSSR